MISKRRLGTVLHSSSSSGNLILKAETKVRIGETVLDGRGREVGTIFDLFGPVSNPFVAVKSGVDDPERYIGEPLFLGRLKR